jgi:hypothetical protein
MVFAAIPLVPAALTEHACVAARTDEERHRIALGTNGPRHHSAETVRGWGQAALHDLEWTSSFTYSRDLHLAYQQAYAAEYLHARAIRGV